MATNTEEYNIIIDTEVTGQENIDLLNKTISTSIGEFEDLQQAIGEFEKALQKVDPNTQQFKDLRKEFIGLKDQFEETTIRSNRFSDALAEQPGIIGVVGQSIKGLDGGLKVLSANPIIGVVTLLSSLFLTLRESLTKTKEGQETLNRISAAFGKILGPVFATIEKVALPIFEKFADLLELVGEGFNKFASFLGISQSKIEEASRNSSEVLKEEYEKQQEYLEDIAKLEAEDRKKRDEAAQKKREEDAKKAEDARKKQLEEEQKRIEAANKILVEAELSLLDDRSREIKEREMRFAEERKTLQAAGITDFTTFEEEFRIDVLAINQKYDDEILKQQEETNKKLAEEQKKADEEAKKQKEEFDKFIVESEQFKADALAAIQDYQLSGVEKVGNILTQIAGKNKKLAIAGVILEQGAAIGKVIVDTARGISAATAAAAPFMANPITAVPATANLARVIAQQKISAALSIAGIVAGAAKGIAQINQAQIPGSASASGGSVGGGGGFNIPAPNISSTSAPQVNTGGGTNPTQQIANTLAMSTDKPIKAYVVSGEVTSAQALDRRTSRASTFG